MSADLARAEAVFLAAIEITDPAQRTKYLDDACAGDTVLKDQVAALLRAHNQPDSLLDQPVVGSPAGAATQAYEGPAGKNTDHTQTFTSEHHEKHDDDLSFLSPTQRPDSLGRIGHYEVLQVLGKGGFGIVFRAFDDVLQRVVAVKVLAPAMAVASPARKRFLREARSSAAVRHENVVAVHAVEEQPLPHLVMEYIPGETLQERIDRTGPLEAVEILKIGRQIAEGLAAAHATGLIHRDIKPSNILVNSGPNPVVKITDFGLARAVDDASLTRSGTVAGTPMYMAPEQARGESLDHRADLFSLGSVLYVMCTGRPPFRANSTPAVLKRVAEDTPRPIREIIPETPKWLCRLIEKLHAKDPAERFQTAREVADILADCEAQVKTHGAIRDYSRIPGEKPRRSRKLPWIAVALMIPFLFPVCLAAFFFVYLRGSYQETRVVDHSPADQRAIPDDGFVPLFNGKDLTGWKTHPDKPGGWRVQDGLLTGVNPPSHLFSERGDYTDFHLRAEVKINDVGNSGLYFRSEYGHGFDLAKMNGRGFVPFGYEVEITPKTGVGATSPTGSVSRLGPNVPLNRSRMSATSDLLQANVWTKLEVIVVGNRITTKVNDVMVVEFTDDAPVAVRGHFALQHMHPNTVVQFRKIELKDLSGAASSPQERIEHFRAIGKAYHQYVEKHNRGPANADELRPFLAGNARAWELLNGDKLMFHYGVGLTEMTEAGTSNTAIAYEALTPSKGGIVLLGDGNVMEVTARIFGALEPAGARKNYGSWTRLFNGKDLTNWVEVHDSRKGEQAPWDFTGDAITLKGQPGSYLRTRKKYREFHLRFEYGPNRHSPAEATGAGAILWGVQDPDDTTKYPAGVRLDLTKALTGGPSLGMVSAAKAIMPGLPSTNIRGGSSDGLWNRAEVISRANELEIIINGQSRIIKDYQPVTGYLGLHSLREGLQFRNLEIREPPPGVSPPATIQALTDKVAARDRELDGVKNRFLAGTASKLDVIVSETEGIEARIQLAEARGDNAGVTRLLRDLLAKLQERRTVVEQLIKAGEEAANALNRIDADIADAKARLAKATMTTP